MNQDIIQGKWKQLKGTLKDKWGKLTDDDLDRLDGNTEYLSGRLQERYGWEKDQADRAVRDFGKSIDRSH